MDVEFTSQLVDSMIEAVSRLEKSIKKNNKDDILKLKTFIFDVHRQISDSLGAFHA